MPRYDFRCTNCGAVREDVWVSNWKDANGHVNERDYEPCCGNMTWDKLPCAPNFTVTGFNAKNRYGRDS